MNPQELPPQRVRGDELDSPAAEILRKIELLFYLIFPILAVVCFVLPPVYHLKYVALYVTAVLSILYSISIYFIRFKLYVHYSILLHFGLFLIFSSSIFFSFGRNRDGIGMVVVGSLKIAMILVLSTMGKWLKKTNMAIIRRNQQRQEAQDQPNQPLEADEGNNPDLPNAQINNLNIVLANGPINPVIDALANDQVIPNGHAIQARDFPLDQVEEPNEQAPLDQQVEGPNEEVVQQVDEPGAPADDQRENPNEQIAPGEQQE